MPTKPSLKIAILHQSLGLVDRGSERSTLLLAKELSHSASVLIISSAPIPQTASVSSIVVDPLDKPLPASPNSLLDKILFRLHLDPRSRRVRTFSRLALPKLRSYAPDITIVTNGSDQLRLIKKALPATKTVVFGRAGIGHDDRSNLRASPHLFVGLTKVAADWARTLAPSSTHVIYLPNPIIFTKPKKPPRLTLPRPILLCVAAHSSYKNVDKVIRSAGMLKLSILIIGEGEQSPKLARLLKKYPGEFRWISHLAPADLIAYYQSADFFCFVPDSQEAFGRVYLEAMAAGLPIVASNDPIRRSIIGPKGIYVDPHSPRSLSEGIQAAAHLPRQDYSSELAPYQLTRITRSLLKEFYDLIKS